MEATPKNPPGFDHTHVVNENNIYLKEFEYRSGDPYNEYNEAVLAGRAENSVVAGDVRGIIEAASQEVVLLSPGIDDMDYAAIKFSGHAVRQMFARAVSVDDVAGMVRHGEIIKEYPDDKPYPSFLMLGFVRGSAVHVVVALDGAAKTAIVITAYLPDKQLWSDDFRSHRGE